MIRFMHAADLHLDSAFHALPPEKARQRRAEQRALLEEIVARCNAAHCDLLLLAGDLFDSDFVYRDTVEALTQALRDCSAQVFISPGNHDFYTSGCPYQTAVWPENVHIFRKPEIEAVPLTALGVTVYGAAFTGREMGPLLSGFHVADSQTRNIMVLHGDLEQADSRYAPLTWEEIARSELDYLALGHVHRRSEALRAGKTLYAYSGCPMGRGFDELGEKGVLLGTLTETSCTVEFLPLSARKYEILNVPAGEDALAAIEAALPPDTARDCYRIVLRGEAEPVDVAALTAALQARFFSLTVLDRTQEKHSCWDGMEDDTLRGLFLRECRLALEQAQDEAERQTVELAAKFTTALLDGREVQL